MTAPQFPTRARRLRDTVAAAGYVSPTSAQIEAAMRVAEHDDQAAALAARCGHWRTFLKWRRGERDMPRASWELYLLATDQHPTHQLVAR